MTQRSAFESGRNSPISAKIKEKIRINTAFKLQLNMVKGMDVRMKPFQKNYLADKLERITRHDR